MALGAIVIATSSSDEKLEFAKKLGATHLINYKTTPDWDQEVLRLTNGVGANHILEVRFLLPYYTFLKCELISYTGWWK